MPNTEPGKKKIVAATPYQNEACVTELKNIAFLWAE